MKIVGECYVCGKTEYEIVHVTIGLRLVSVVLRCDKCGRTRSGGMTVKEWNLLLKRAGIKSGESEC